MKKKTSDLRRPRKERLPQELIAMFGEKPGKKRIKTRC